MGVEGLGLEKGARFGQVQTVGGQAESLEDSDNASCGLGYGRVFDKQGTPNGIGLLRFGKSEILFR